MSKKRIAIIGAGGQAREVEWLIREINQDQPAFEFLGYIVGDLSKLGELDSSNAVLGDESWLDTNRDQVDCLAIGIGNPQLRLRLGTTLTDRFPGIEWPTLIHPSAIYDRSTCKFGPGVLLASGSICTVSISIGAYALLNFGATVGHETQIGKGSVVNPGANISGGVVVGDEVLVGTGAQILQYLRIGSGARIGAGAVVTKHVASGTTVVGVPATVCKDIKA